MLAYDYIADGRISKVTHPSGRVVQYSHDAHGPVSLIRMRETVSSPLVKVFKQIKHTAMSGSRSAGFGGDYGLWSLASGLFENGHQMTVTRDLDGRVTRLKTGTVMDLTFGFDLNSNITSITDAIDGARNGSFQYDPLNRLTQAVGSYGTIDYAYDLVGNRTALTRTGGTGASGLQTASYSYGSTSHRLNSVTSGASRTMSYLASGQMSSDSTGGVSKTYDYDAEGRMVAAYEGGVLQASYDYDAYGQQKSKTQGGSGVHLIHDPFGRLIAEHDGATGAALREYLYLGLMPIAMVDHSGASPVTYYIHTDQVMQPQKMTDATGTVVWDRVATPFGVEVMASGSLTQGLRFPGQLHDSETALNQNWHREYNPMLGRYVQSDPIGLLGGINTYGYVAGNPLKYVDHKGLAYVPPGVEGHGSITFGPGVTIGWTVVDLPPTPENPIRAECRCGTQPEPEADVDFYQDQNGKLIKLFSGDVTINSDGQTAVPSTVDRLGGLLSVPSTFPADNPPTLYKAKQALDSVLGDPSQSPLEYLKSLKALNPSCKNLPIN